MQLEQLFDQLFFLLTFIITVVIVLVSIAIGFRLGSDTRKNKKSEKNPSISTVVGAMLALLAFILAFTFSMTSSRFDARKQLVLDEANAIETAMLRTDFLAESPRNESLKLLKEYVDIRIDAVQHPEKVPQALVDSEAIHERLWSQAIASSNQTKDSELLGRYIDSLNEIIDLHSERVVVGIQYRIPKGVWYLVYGITILAMLAVGYEFGINNAFSFHGSLFLALMFSAVILIVVDLDDPSRSLFLEVSQQPLIELQQKLNSSVK
jgi:hypothetical protein